MTRSLPTDSGGQRPLADVLEDLLPQTQCTQCGYPSCRLYAEAMARGEAACNQCPPGGAQGAARLAHALGKPVLPLNPAHGTERPRRAARIDESLCIGCTLCIQACPVDAIVGAAKQMHAVLTQWCTGCDLCVAPCPVDCIAMIEVTPGRTGWDAWSAEQAGAARARHAFRRTRLKREQEENDARLAAKAQAKLKEMDEPSGGSPAQRAEHLRKKAIVQAALERARQKQARFAQLTGRPEPADATLPGSSSAAAEPLAQSILNQQNKK